ncbi:GntR family transcriptional regulator [Pseudactinotalea sp. HY158]|uniref:GntR family transcriptional regulator n=1 Tax=Pseudactinotalea sp. HY158 TaxID=2654547 RepID=UPI00129C33B5|nr:GntR family transcriptional regulator [Pseudactinotalea sp. HY158]QGH70709.1 FCD domain-containing protein [Pseudactinotalea sp. HY158]
MTNISEEQPPAKPDGRKTRGERSETLVEHVRSRILEDIIRARLRPGEMVQLTALANQYEVSRTPVREALALLEHEGVVSAIAYKGYLVRPIEPRDVHDIFFMRRLLETAGIELAAKRLSRSDLLELRGLKLPDADEMTLEYDNVSRSFHRTILVAAGSPRLLATFDELYNDVRRMQYAGIGTPRPDLIHEEHLHIVDALDNGDGALASKRMAEHLDLVRERALTSWVSSF